MDSWPMEQAFGFCYFGTLAVLWLAWCFVEWRRSTMEELKTFLDHGARIDNSQDDPETVLPVKHHQQIKTSRKRQRQARKAQGRD